MYADGMEFCLGLQFKISFPHGENVITSKREAEVITLSTHVKPMQCINGGKWFMLIPYFHRH